MKKSPNNSEVSAKPKEENWLAKERRLKARRQTFKMVYKKGLFFENKQRLIEYLQQPDIIVRANAAGDMEDGTEFIQITIEGFKPIS